MTIRARVEPKGVLSLDDVEPIVRDDRFEIHICDHGDFGFSGSLHVSHAQHGEWFDWREDETSAVYNRAYELAHEVSFASPGKAVAAAKAFLKRYGAGNVEVLKQDSETGDWLIVWTLRRDHEEGWKDQPDTVQAPEPKQVSGAIYELDAAGEAEIQRIAREPQVTETEDGIFITMPGPDTARIADLESALVEVARLLDDGTIDGWEGSAEAKAILDRVGLAHRLDGNSSKAEQVTA